MVMEHYRADSRKIRGLFFNTEMSNQDIASHIGISRMSVYNIRTGNSKMGNVSLEVASRLTKLYEQYLEEHEFEKGAK